MKMTRSILLAAAVAAFTASAADPRVSFAYQGRLCNALGSPALDTTYHVSIRLLDGPGAFANVLWERQTTVTTDTNGLFQVELSDDLGSRPEVSPTEPLRDILRRQAERELYVGLEVAGSAGEIRPRQKIVSAPFALFANDAVAALEGFAVKGKLDAGGLVVTNKVNLKRALTVAGGFSAFADAAFGTVSAADAAFESAATFDGKASVGELVSGNDISIAGGASVGSLAVGAGGITANGVDLDLHRGMIVMWWGKADEVPKGWAICNGQNGTPDLRGRFVVGAGASQASGAAPGTASDKGAAYRLNDIGGSAEVVLSNSQVPTHHHAVMFYRRRMSGTSTMSHYSYTGKGGAVYDGKDPVSPVVSTSAGGTQLGEVKPHQNLPSYCAIYYIMRIVD